MAPEAQIVVRSAQGWLQSSCQVQVPFAWLEACVQWLQEEAGGAGRLTQQQINKQVYDQWLLTDLRDLDHPVFPEGLAQSQKTVLSGIFCVQVDSVMDVSQPAYGQLQKWKGTDCTNDEVSAVTQFTQRPWESRPTRMLLLQVTDGVQNMEAMEYQPISALSPSLRPGVKLRLQGDIPCRLGMMLLGPTNVKLLGGEVDDLVDRNNQGRLLCRTLGLPEEEQPQPEEEEPPPAQQGTQDLEDLDLDDQELLASLEAQEQGEQLRGVGSASDSGYSSRFESTHSSGSSAAWIHGSTASSRSEASTSSLRYAIQNSRAGSLINQPEGPLNQDYSMADQDCPDEDFDDLPLDELESVILQDPGIVPPQNQSKNSNITAPTQPCNPPKTAPTQPYNPPKTVPAQPYNPPKTAPTQPYNPPKTVPTQPYNPPKTAPTQPYNPPKTAPTQPYNPPKTAPTQPYNPPKTAPTQPYNPPKTAPTQPYNPPKTAPTQPYNPPKTVPTQPYNPPKTVPTQPYNPPKTVPAQPLNPPKTAPIYNDDFMDEDLEFIGEMEAATSSNQPSTSNTGQNIANSVSLTSPPFTYICLLNDVPNKPTSGRMEIVVKAFIVTLIGKLSSGDGFWKVGATISDGTGYLDVELSDEVLRGLLGFSVAEKAALKRDPAQKGELEAGMRRCQEGLVDMCCVMTLCLDLGEGKALVTKAEPVNEQDLRALEERVKASK